MNTKHTNIEHRILITLQQVAWERTKVDLAALRSWFLAAEEHKVYDKLVIIIHDFIVKIEDESPLV